jgi:hypothetical protein
LENSTKSQGGKEWILTTDFLREILESKDCLPVLEPEEKKEEGENMQYMIEVIRYLV